MGRSGRRQQTEREAKLSVGTDFEVPDLDGIVDGLVAVSRPDRELHATYFDSSDLRLARAGITVRCRTGDRDDRGEWTVKLPRAADTAGHLNRTEITFPGACGLVPDPVIDLVRARARSAPLEPVATVVTRRRTIELRDADGHLCAEIDDDDVTVMADGHARDRFREVEVELAAGAPIELLAAVVDRLRAAGARPADPVPKVLRVLGPAAREPPDLVVPPLDKHSRLETVVAAAVARGFNRLVEHDPAVRLGGEPEAVHQARVATRRLRSDLRTLRPRLDRSRVSPLRDELKWLGAALGKARDGDVLLERVQGDLVALDEQDRRAGTTLVERLERERDEARNELLSALASERYVALLDALVAFATTPPLSEDGDARALDVLPELVARQWRRLRRAVAKLPESPSDDELHQLRIQVKHVRYAAELAAPVVGGPSREFARALAALQDELGALHDAVVTEHWLRATAASVGGAAAFVAGLLAAKARERQVEGRRQWRALWRRARRQTLTRWLE